jgi:hypothetical protein
MTQEVDEKLGTLLRAGAPPERDPLFRIRVLERRESDRFRQRSRGLIAGAVGAVLIHVIALALAPNVLVAGISAVLCLVVVAAAAISFRAAAQAVRSLRGS